MTGAARGALVATAVFAVLDWIAVARRNKTLEYIAKPMTMAALIAVALALQPDDEARRVAFVAALALSLLGDVFLMLPSNRFVLGIAAFAGAHVAYIVGFRLDDSSSSALILGAVLVVAFAVTVGRRVLAGVREKERAFAGPVSAYIAIISVMVAGAIATQDPVATAGALIFMASDSLIAWNRFVRPLAWAPVTIMVTYHTGQVLLVSSLFRGGG